MGGATDILMMGGVLLMGYMIFTNMGAITASISNMMAEGNRIVRYVDYPNEDEYEEYSNNIECRESECRYCGDAPDPSNCGRREKVCGDWVETEGEDEQEVHARAYEQWRDEFDERSGRCRLVGNVGSGGRSVVKKTTTTTTPTAPSGTGVGGLKPIDGKCSIKLSDCIRANPGMRCSLSAGSRCKCSCKPIPKSAYVVRQPITLYKRGHDGLNIPRAYLVQSDYKTRDLHLRYE